MTHCRTHKTDKVYQSIITHCRAHKTYKSISSLWHTAGLGSGRVCGLWLWHSLDFSLTFFTKTCECVWGLGLHVCQKRKHALKKVFFFVFFFSSLYYLLSVCYFSFLNIQLWLLHCTENIHWHNPQRQIKHIISTKRVLIFFLFLHENLHYGYSLDALHLVLLISTHNVCFCGEIRKILISLDIPLSWSYMKIWHIIMKEILNCSVFGLNVSSSTLSMLGKNFSR